jgi:quercetin dioxygenase-like cupin family protein
VVLSDHRCGQNRDSFGSSQRPRREPIADALTVIRHADRPSVTLPGGAAYRPIIGDDTGEGLPIRTGIQTSQPGYATPLHSHPYAEILTVVEGRVRLGWMATKVW